MKKLSLILLAFILIFTSSINTYAISRGSKHLDEDILLSNQQNFDFYSYDTHTMKVEKISKDEYYEAMGGATEFVIDIITTAGRSVGKAILKKGGKWLFTASVGVFGSAAVYSMGVVCGIAGLSLAALVVSIDQSEFRYAYDYSGSIIDRNGNKISINTNPKFPVIYY